MKTRHIGLGSCAYTNNCIISLVSCSSHVNGKKVRAEMGDVAGIDGADDF